MFPKKVYVQQFDDESLNAERSEADLLGVSENGDAFAVYELKQTGTVVEHKRLVFDNPRQKGK